MYRHFNHFLKKEVVILNPGEYYSSVGEEIISTVLGSCVAVVLFDPILEMGGMNHFMLPELVNPETKNQLFLSGPGKYGLYAMELLINDMLKKGAVKKRLQAKIFGGASVLAANSSTRAYRKSGNNIPDNNIKFAKTFLETEEIPLIGGDTGGNSARKILLYPREFRVMQKRYAHSAQTTKERLDEEKRYAKQIESRLNVPRVTLFED